MPGATLIIIFGAHIENLIHYQIEDSLSVNDCLGPPNNVNDYLVKTVSKI